MEPNKRCIKARTGFLKDPVKIDAQKAAAEGAMLGPGAATGVKHKQLCKETLDEAPQAYKEMGLVMEALRDTIDIVDHLTSVVNLKGTD